jgi:hypothetical protein
MFSVWGFLNLCLRVTQFPSSRRYTRNSKIHLLIGRLKFNSPGEPGRAEADSLKLAAIHGKSEQDIPRQPAPLAVTGADEDHAAGNDGSSAI